MFHPIRRHLTFERAVGQIAEAIANGTLRSGQPLPGERALAAEMDVSRRTIREAIKTLAEAGIVEVVPGPGGGMSVRSEMVPTDLTFHVETHITELSDVLEARRLIEPRVAQLAGIYAEREDFEELERIAMLQREHAVDRERYLTLESRFHLTLARVARNTVLYDTMKNIFGRAIIAFDLGLETGPAGTALPARHPPADPGRTQNPRSRRHRRNHGRAPQLFSRMRGRRRAADSAFVLSRRF